MKAVTMERGIGFFGGDVLSSLCPFTRISIRNIVSSSVYADPITHKFHKFDNASIIPNEFDGNSDIMHDVKCEKKNESETSPCRDIWFAVFSIAYVANRYGM